MGDHASSLHAASLINPLCRKHLRVVQAQGAYRSADERFQPCLRRCNCHASVADPWISGPIEHGRIEISV